MHDQVAGNNQFDFWLGEWKLSWGEGGRGTNKISKILNGRVIQESFSATPFNTQDAPPYQGLSVSTYDESNQLWRQTWVDSQGAYLDFTGTFTDGKMILSRDAILNEKPIQQRMIFYNIQPNSLDWSWERSEDNGRSWTPVWQIKYTR